MKCTKFHATQHDFSFNFWVGCHRISEGCKNCYMFLEQQRRGIDPTSIRRCTTTWGKPLRWQREAAKAGEFKSVFACSYSDFFLPEADEWRDDAWDLIRETPNLIWRLASKRTHLIADRLPADWGNGYENVWLGTSAELKKYLSRLDYLRKIPCVLRWVDFAPTLEDLMPDLSDHIEGFGWVIVSGEQGCNKVEPRPFDAQWARNIRDLCADRGIPFRFSHVAGRNWHPSRLLDGVLHNEAPSLIPEVGEIKPGGCEVAMCA
jgi:protein gp37